MPMILRFTLASLLFSLFVPTICGQVSNSPEGAVKGDRFRIDGFFPIAELREGMTAKARTVFKGRRSEEFNVEIIGVVPGWIGPKQDMIVGRIYGGNADRTKVFAGMSGSPVYIGHRLVGAISYAFPFSKEGICGITPIHQMIGMFERTRIAKPAPKKPVVYSFSELSATEWSNGLKAPDKIIVGATNEIGPAGALAAAGGGTLKPIALPISFNGISRATLKEFAPELLAAGLLPVSSLGGGSGMGPLKKADETTLIGGDSVVMHLTRGDISMSASGTVTYRDGEKIYAFGHPFLSLGASDLPMSESHVVTVVPSLNNSFKLAVPDEMVGTMTQDRATGVFGKLGKAPKMIPVNLNLTTTRGQERVFRFEMANDRILTPLLLNMAVFNTITSNERSLGDLTIEVDGIVKVSGHDGVRVDARFAGQNASRLAAAAMVVPVGNLLKSRFEDLDIAGISVRLASRDGSSTASIERIAVDRTEIRAGEVLGIRAFVRTNTGRTLSQEIRLKIPEDTPPGPVTIEVGDGSLLQKKTAAQKFVPKNLEELISKINGIRKNDRLYVRAYRAAGGAIVGANELSNLPPSVIATLNNNRTSGGFKSMARAVIAEEEVAPAEFLITGQRSISIRVLN